MPASTQSAGPALPRVAAPHTQLTSLQRPAPPPGPPNPDKPVAVFVSHGMGQQVPFETLTRVAELLQAREDLGAAPPVVGHVRLFDPDTRQETWLPRAEVELADRHGGPARRVHIYEAYWAPLTEDVIKLPEVVRFLATAGWRGLRLKNQLKWLRRWFRLDKYYRRWMFGSAREFVIPNSTPLKLLGALVLVMALVSINAILGLVIGANLLDMSKLTKMPTALVDWLTLDLLVLLVPAVLGGLGLWWSQRLTRQLGRLSRQAGRRTPRKLRRALHKRRRQRKRLNVATTAALGLAVLALLTTAGLLAYHYFSMPHVRPPGSPDPSWLLTRLGGSYDSSKDAWRPGGATVVRMLLIALVWGGTAGVSLVLRNFLVQYLGDVAIYLDSYKVDRFHRVREQVKKLAHQTACVIYGACEQPPPDAPATAPLAFAYDRIIVVGHSLGSVVAYDALNATLNLDEGLGGHLHTAGRTGGLITFGSPLDKTAYIFHTRSAPNSLRPPLTASVQPLIRDEAARKQIVWYNIYSKADPISGPLDYYDLPRPRTGQPNAEPPKDWAVRNRRDLDSSTPVAAHSQYWDNHLLAHLIRQRIFA
ncbi:hypothetical protein EJV47_20785 [Hymenobacter gummosus]|uniref:Uncharacterized protein n=1 Tax=Hymenobacter gummosus TaxID=1776032 RepID=A0A3S0IKT2_9BACT|nr:hypothetical protein [Hymenobacter gummosus]RTQ46811.1 hypothetical protein EJV47_20785 [Hymenobacter gummosus]